VHHTAACVAYESRINNVDELKQRLIEVWSGLQQNIVDIAVSEWRKRLRTCVRTLGHSPLDSYLEGCDWGDISNIYYTGMQQNKVAP